MPKLEVKENKKLILKNVLHKELKGISLEYVDQEIQNFVTRIEILKAQVFGPLVIRSSGTNINDLGEVSVDYDLYLQAHDYKQYKNEFLIEDCHACEHCLYLHFEGSPQDLGFAQTKLDLHLYEQELDSNGVSYMVCISESESFLMVDLFRPVIIS